MSQLHNQQFIPHAVCSNYTDWHLSLWHGCQSAVVPLTSCLDNYSLRRSLDLLFGRRSPAMPPGGWWRARIVIAPPSLVLLSCFVLDIISDPSCTGFHVSRLLIVMVTGFLLILGNREFLLLPIAHVATGAETQDVFLLKYLFFLRTLTDLK